MTSARHDTPAYISAAELTASTPLGAIVRYTDFTPEPPARFKNKHSDWKTRNNTGRLISVTPGDGGHPGMLTLHEGDYGSRGVVVITFRKTFHLDTPLRFAVVELPAPGSFVVVTRYRDTTELLHLAAGEADAKAWLARNPYNGASIEPVATTQSAFPLNATPAL